jgi:hypothetical protein
VLSKTDKNHTLPEENDMRTEAPKQKQKNKLYENKCSGQKQEKQYEERNSGKKQTKTI